MDDFDLFWSVYPKKKSKGDARKAWIQTAGIRPKTDELLEAVERGKRSIDWHRCDKEGCKGAFIPYPASYLRGEMWEDDYTVALCSIGNTHRREVEQAVAAPPTQEQVEKVRDMLKSVRLRRVA